MREWLRTLRIEKKMSEKDAASTLGISEKYYRAIEAGVRQKKMDIVLVAGIAAMFQMSVAEIMNMEQRTI